jgi:hypothetical protein
VRLFTRLAKKAPTGAATTPPVIKPNTTGQLSTPTKKRNTPCAKEGYKEFCSVDRADRFFWIFSLVDNIGSNNGSPSAAPYCIHESTNQGQEAGTLYFNMFFWFIAKSFDQNNNA